MIETNLHGNILAIVLLNPPVNALGDAQSDSAVKANVIRGGRADDLRRSYRASLYRRSLESYRDRLGDHFALSSLLARWSAERRPLERQYRQCKQRKGTGSCRCASRSPLPRLTSRP